MKLTFTLLILTMMANAAPSRTKVVYGEDNRKDLYEISNPEILKLAKGTAGLVDLNLLGQNTDHYFLKQKITLEQGLNICPTERFAEQPLAPNCSGFLIKEDILITAGHCYSGRSANNCKTHAWLFDYAMESVDSVNTDQIEKNNVYFCKKVIKVKFNSTEDFAIIQLDRKVTGREPLKYRKDGKVSIDSSLMVIGHPSLLPTKISPGATVLANNDPFQFTTNLDTFQGNSGSAVFNQDTNEIEGILVSGKTDYIPSHPNDPNSCLIVNNCDMKGSVCDGKDRGSIEVPGENVTRITTLLKYLPN